MVKRYNVLIAGMVVNEHLGQAEACYNLTIHFHLALLAMTVDRKCVSWQLFKTKNKEHGYTIVSFSVLVSILLRGVILQMWALPNILQDIFMLWL